MKLFFRLKIAILFLFASKSAMAQNQAENAKKDPVFVRLQWDNDLIRTFSQKSDKYYTNGTKVDLYGNFLKIIPTSHLLFKFKNPTSQLYHLKFGQEIYTPEQILSPEIQSQDRPYCGWLYGTHGVTSYDENSKEKLTAELQLGMTGPIAFAGEAQTEIHKLTESEMPEGWGYQLSNNFGINYRLGFEKGIYGNKYFEVIPGIKASVGNVQNYAEFGTTFRLGLLDNYFRHNNEFDLCPGEEKNKFRIFLTARPMVGGVLYNSLLQGAMFGEKAPHVLASDEINRLYFGAQYGINIEYGRFRLTVGETFQTAEFKGGKPMNYGSVGLRVRLD